MGKTPDLGQRAEELRELTREANGTHKDLRAAIAEARKVAPEIVKEHLNKAVAEAIAELGQATQAAIEAAEKRVVARFDELSKTLLGEPPKTKPKGRPASPTSPTRRPGPPRPSPIPASSAGTSPGAAVLLPEDGTWE